MVSDHASDGAGATTRDSTAGDPAAFNLPGPNYNAPATDDAFARTAAALGLYLVN